MMQAPPKFIKYGNFEAERGLARVKLAKSDSRTVLSHLQTKAPLLVQRALYLNPYFPGMAHVYLMSSAGGILQGDRLDIDIYPGENTMSHFTTQAATKIYRMNKGFASQTISITTAPRSYIEFVPHELIPFRSSKYYQNVTMDVSPDSTVVYCETVCAGRTASGESFDFDVCFLRMTARRPGGSTIFSDVCNIEPNGKRFKVLFGDKTIWSTIYVVTQSNHECIDREISLAIHDRGILAGCSTLPRDSGLFVRILDDSIDNVTDLTNAIVEIARKHAARE